MDKNQWRKIVFRVALAALVFASAAMVALWIVSYRYRLGIIAEGGGCVYGIETWDGHIQVKSGYGELPGKRSYAVIFLPRTVSPLSPSYRFSTILFWTWEWWWLLPLTSCVCAAYWLLAQLHPSLRISIGEAARRHWCQEQKRCENCGYDLTRSKWRCPECGKPFTE